MALVGFGNNVFNDINVQADADFDSDVNIDGDLTVGGTIFGGNIETSLIRDASNSTSITTEATTDTIIFRTFGGEAMRIDGLGNVGIGNPSVMAKLDVSGGDIWCDNLKGTLITAAQPNISSVNTLTVGSTTANVAIKGNNSSIDSSLQLVRDSATSYQLTNDNGNYEISQYTDGVGTLTDFYSYTGSSHRFSTSGTEKVRIDTAGNLGIGIAVPTSTLHIKSATTPQLLIDNDTFAQNNIKFQSNRTATNILSDLSWFNDDVTNVEVARMRIRKADDPDGNGEIQFHTANGVSLIERMTIANNGFVGINHTPSYQLDIGGMTRIVGEVDSTIDGGGVFTQTYFDKSILLNRDASVYRNYYIGLLGDNTTTGNKFSIGIDGGAGNNPDPQMSLDSAGRMVLADGLSIGSETATSELYVVGNGHFTSGLTVVGTATVGKITQTDWNSGDTVQSKVFLKTDTGLGNDTLTINVGGYVKIADVSFTPKSTTSRLLISCDFNYGQTGTGVDTVDCKIEVSSLITAYKAQTNTADGDRSCSLSPIQGVYDNSTLSVRAISVEVRRNSSDDTLSIFRSSGISLSVIEIED